VVLALMALAVLIVFIAQNNQRSTVHFFGFEGTAPTAVVLLIAAVAGGLVVVGIAMARLLQLRTAARRTARLPTGAVEAAPPPERVRTAAIVPLGWTSFTD
jgi:lipopolysaccharide assembly protein A